MDLKNQNRFVVLQKNIWAEKERKKVLPGYCEKKNSSYLCSPLREEGGFGESVNTGWKEKEKKVLPSAWRFKKSSYLCSPLQPEAFFRRRWSHRPEGKREKKFCRVLGDRKSLLTFATRSEKSTWPETNRADGREKKIESFAWKLESFSDLCTPKTTSGSHGTPLRKTQAKHAL